MSLGTDHDRERPLHAGRVGCAAKAELSGRRKACDTGIDESELENTPIFSAQSGAVTSSRLLTYFGAMPPLPGISSHEEMTRCGGSPLTLGNRYKLAQTTGQPLAQCRTRSMTTIWEHAVALDSAIEFANDELEEIANVAVFMASDKASGMTGTTVNLTMGSLDD
jgi:hypothetical protein